MFLVTALFASSVSLHSGFIFSRFSRAANAALRTFSFLSFSASISGSNARGSFNSPRAQAALKRTRQSLSFRELVSVLSAWRVFKLVFSLLTLISFLFISSFLPQFWQNLAFCVLGVPHSGHVLCDFNLVPQFWQKIASSKFLYPHFGQIFNLSEAMDSFIVCVVG